MGILPTKSQIIDDPLFAHGLVFLGPDPPVVLVVVDWCEIRNGAYEQWRETLASAAGTSADRVLISAVHQHDAPVVDRDAARLLAEVGLRGELYDEAFHDDVLQRVAQAVQRSLSSAMPVTQIGVGRANVYQVASNRRVERRPGVIAFDRGSRSGADPELAAAPEGMVDPMLRSISFFSGQRVLATLHCFATHPMSQYGQGRVSADFVGRARELRRQDDPGVLQIYASGCSGDVTAGKYNDGSDAARDQLAQRLYQGMLDAWQSTHVEPLKRIAFRCRSLRLDFNPSAQLTAEALSARLRDPSLPTERRILAAMGLASRQRVEADRLIDVPCIDLGAAQIVLLPAESFVAFQLSAQAMRPDCLVMTLGYGECWPGYIPTESAFADQFSDDWLWVAPGSESRLTDALRQLLTPM